MTKSFFVRPAQSEDHASWRKLWDGYNRFYGRSGSSALSEGITAGTWKRILDPKEPVVAFVVCAGLGLIGLAHCVVHRSTIRIEDTCYLQDLFTDPAHRGRGIGRSLIEETYRWASQLGIRRVYWQTHHSNTEGRQLYERLAEHSGFIVYAKNLTPPTAPSSIV